MAYTTTITKSTVKKAEGGYIISVNVVVNDGSEDIFERVFSKRHISADPISEVKTVLESKIKAAWDKFKAERAVLEQTEFNTLCSDLTNSIGNHINA